MAGVYNGAVVTSVGAALIASAIAGGDTVEWTKARTSSSQPSTPLEALTSLTDIEQTVDISFAQVVNSNVIQVSARFPNENVLANYYIEAIGIYAKVSGGSETLIAVVTATTPDEQEAGSGTSMSAHIYNIQMQISNASSVTMQVSSAGTASATDLSLLQAQIASDLALKVDITTLQAIDTPVQVTIATTDWTASGVNWTCTKTCTKATTDAYCVLKLVPANPGTLTAAQLKTLQKNLSYLYPRPTVGSGNITFLTSTKPTISLTFDVVGGAVS